MTFDGAGVVVTGGLSGIGRACGQLFAAEGAEVVLLDLEEPRQEGADQDAGDVQHVTVLHCDVRSASDVELLSRSVGDRLGVVDVLVNSAGVTVSRDMSDLTESQWDLVLDTNLKGVFLVSQAFIPLLRLSTRAAIVNVASVHALSTQPRATAYAAAKGGVLSLTRSMALEYAGDHIRVNCVCPGSVNTPMLRRGAMAVDSADPESVLARWGRQQPIGRLIEPEEVAEAIAYLASDRASAITAACLTVDGGLSAVLALGDH